MFCLFCILALAYSLANGTNSWQMEISITNEESGPVTQVLLLLNTSSWLTAPAKIASSHCNDVTFTSDVGELLAYWFENACPGSVANPITRVWLAIYLDVGQTSVITMKSYDQTLADVPQEEAWTGKFYSFNVDDGCGRGWTMDESTFGVFAKIGEIGEITSAESHFHNFSVSDRLTAGGFPPDCLQTESDNGIFDAAPTSLGYYKYQTETIQSPEPGHASVFFCYNTKYDFVANMMSLFDYETESELSETYSGSSDIGMNGLFLKSSDSFLRVNGSDFHTHGMPTTTERAIAVDEPGNRCSVSMEPSDDFPLPYTTNHWHNLTTNISSSYHVPLYHDFVAGRLDNSVGSLITTHHYVLSNSIPPLGFERVYTYDGKFIRINNVSADGGAATHSHNSDFITATDQQDSVYKYGMTIQAGSSMSMLYHPHTHRQSFVNSDSKPNDLPSYAMFLLKRKSTGTMTKVVGNSGTWVYTGTDIPVLPSVVSGISIGIFLAGIFGILVFSVVVVGILDCFGGMIFGAILKQSK